MKYPVENESVGEVIEKMVNFVIENEVRKAPYIALVSKKSLWWGNGRFKNSAYPKGLRGALGIKVPSDTEIQEKNFYYGYPALIKPWSFLNNITNVAIRQKILWEIIDEKSYSDIRPILGRGYIRENGTLDPNQTQGMSCYVFFLADPSVREQQNGWIKNQPFFVRAQIFRNQTTHVKLLAQKKRAASHLVENNSKLLAFQEYKQIEAQVDREQITWPEEDT